MTYGSPPGEESCMRTAPRWTSADLEVLPDDGKRYEIIDGELYMSRQPHWHHQRACVKICTALEAWSVQTGAGEANLAPGVIFADDDDVAPRRGLDQPHTPCRGAGGQMVISTPRQNWSSRSHPPVETNERRDREAKLKLYSRRGVLEYWIVDWRTQQVEVYRT